MPLTRSAIKKLRQDKKRKSLNEEFEKKLKAALKKAKKDKKLESLKDAFSFLDKAVKNNIFHKNKAARLKSSLSKLISAKQDKKEEIKAPASKAKKGIKTTTKKKTKK